MANVLAFLSGNSRRDWSQQELAEFYRVERALSLAGLSVLTDRGLSDEGDPWFVFCRADDGEVVVHFARIDGQYVVAGPAYDGIASGVDIRSIATDLVGRHPLMQRRLPQGDNVILHPAALLVAIVAVALLKSSEAQAHSSDDPLVATSRMRDASHNGEEHRSESVYSAVLDARHVAIVISAAMIAMSLTSGSHQSELNEIADLALPGELDSDGSTSDGLISALQVSHSFDERTVIENKSSSDGSTDVVDGQPNLSGEQSLELLSFIAVLNDVAGPVMQASDDSQVQTISDIFGPAAAQTLAVAFASSSEGVESMPAGPAAIIEVEMDGLGAFPPVRSLTFVGPDEVSYTAEFEIVSALPLNLQPYLAHGLTLEAASSSAGDVLMALNIEPLAEALDASISPVGIEAPPVGIEAPPVGIEAPPVGIEAPPVGIEAPPVGIEAPPVGIEAPPVGIQAPAILPSTDTVNTDHALNSLGSAVSLEKIADYIQDFIANADRLKMILADGDAIFLDVRAVNQEDPTLGSITWEFADGTSISLIGSRADLPHEFAA